MSGDRTQKVRASVEAPSDKVEVEKDEDNRSPNQGDTRAADGLRSGG